MHKSLCSQIMDSAITRSFSNHTFKPSNPNKIADFCLNNCPHKDADCINGTCEEFEQFDRQRKETKRNKRSKK